MGGSNGNKPPRALFNQWRRIRATGLLGRAAVPAQHKTLSKSLKSLVLRPHVSRVFARAVSLCCHHCLPRQSPASCSRSPSTFCWIRTCPMLNAIAICKLTTFNVSFWFGHFLAIIYFILFLCATRHFCTSLLVFDWKLVGPLLTSRVWLSTH